MHSWIFVSAAEIDSAVGPDIVNSFDLEFLSGIVSLTPVSVSIFCFVVPYLPIIFGKLAFPTVYCFCL